MQNKRKKTLKKYDNFSDTFKYAFVGIPKEVAGINNDFYGTYDEFLEQYPNVEFKKKIPIVLYMHGSSGLYTGDRYRRYIVEQVGALFFAPNSHKLRNRPTYSSPVKEKNI